MLRVVVDTNLWIRALLGGRVTLPLLVAWQQGRFEVIVSQPLLDELDEVWRRPRLQARIDGGDAIELLDQLRERGVMIEIVTVPPNCRDPQDHPILATAIDGLADAVVTGDNDLRADEVLRTAMLAHGVELWGLDRLFAVVAEGDVQSGE